MGLVFLRKIYIIIFLVQRADLFIPSLSISSLFILMKFVVLLMGHFIFSSQENRSQSIYFKFLYFSSFEAEYEASEFDLFITLKISKEGRLIC